MRACMMRGDRGSRAKIQGFISSQSPPPHPPPRKMREVTVQATMLRLQCGELEGLMLLMSDKTIICKLHVAIGTHLAFHPSKQQLCTLPKHAPKMNCKRFRARRLGIRAGPTRGVAWAAVLFGLLAWSLWEEPEPTCVVRMGVSKAGGVQGEAAAPLCTTVTVASRDISWEGLGKGSGPDPGLLVPDASRPEAEAN